MNFTFFVFKYLEQKDNFCIIDFTERDIFKYTYSLHILLCFSIIERNVFICHSNYNSNIFYNYFSSNAFSSELYPQ